MPPTQTAVGRRKAGDGSPGPAASAAAVLRDAAEAPADAAGPAALRAAAGRSRSRLRVPAVIVARTLWTFTTTIWTQLVFAFLQSRVACDAPLAPGDFTGSAYCGDRIRVLGGAQEMGAVMRVIFSVASTVLIAPNALLRDLLSRRACAILCHANVVIAWIVQAGIAWSSPSELVRLVHCVQTALGPFLVQAGLPDILYDTVMQDADSRTRLPALDHTCTLAATLLGRVTGLWLAGLQIVDFGPVITALTVLHTGVLLLCFCIPPAPCIWASPTVVAGGGGDGAPKQHGGVPSVREVAAMCKEVIAVARTDRLFYWSLIESIFSGCSMGANSLQMPMLMARHPSLTLVFKNTVDLVSSILVLPCPGIGMAMARTFGLRPCILFGEVCELTLGLLNPVLAMTFGAPYYAVSTVLQTLLGSLQGAAQSGIEMCKPHMKSELRGRSSAVIAVLTSVSSAAVGYPLVHVFGVTATSGAGTSSFFVVFYVFYVAEKLLWWTFQWPFFGEQADIIERDYRLEMARAASGGAAKDAKQAGGEKED